MNCNGTIEHTTLPRTPLPRRALPRWRERGISCFPQPITKKTGMAGKASRRRTLSIRLFQRDPHKNDKVMD